MTVEAEVLLVDNLSMTDIIRSGNIKHLKIKSDRSVALINPKKYLNQAISSKQPEIFIWLFNKAIEEYKYNNSNKNYNPYNDLLSNLTLSVETGDVKMVECVMEIFKIHKPELYIQINIYTEICARKGYLDILIYFNKCGYDVFNKTNLMLAAAYGHLNIVKWILTTSSIEYDIDYEILARLEQYEVLEWLFINHLYKQPRSLYMTIDFLHSLHKKESVNFDGNIVPCLSEYEYVNMYNLIKKCKKV